MLEGLIIKTALGIYTVKAGEDELPCRPRGRFRIEGGVPLAGDRVRVERDSAGNGVITEILPRGNSLVRPPVANVTRLVILASVAPPVTGFALIDYLTALAEYKDIEPLICINKSDLADNGSLEGLYRSVGLKAVSVSAKTGEGLGELASQLGGGLSVLTGNSGVGKSSVLRALGYDTIAGALSERIGRGRQTTRHVELLPIGGGWVADTPGYSTFDAVEMEMTDSERLPYCFPEFAPYLGLCRYADCGHVRDEGCAVTAAVEHGEIPRSRHESYVKLRERMKEFNSW